MAGQGCRVTWVDPGGVYCWPGPSGFARAVHVPRRTAPLPGNHRPVEAGPPPQARSRRLSRYPATQNGFPRRPKAPERAAYLATGGRFGRPQGSPGSPREGYLATRGWGFVPKFPSLLWVDG